MNNKNTKIQIIITAVVLYGLGVLTGFIFFSNNVSPATSDTVGTVERLRSGSTQIVDENKSEYKNETYNFSLRYPNELAVQEFEEENGETIVFQKPGELFGFQMYITPYTESAITDSRIKQDIPSGIIREPTQVVIGDDIQALIFWSQASIIGESREVWFVKDGYLFEITTYAELDQWLADILKTLTFN